MNNNVSFFRKLEVYFYALFTMVGVYFTLVDIQTNIVRAVLDRNAEEIPTIDLGLFFGLVMTAWGITFLILCAKRDSKK